MRFRTTAVIITLALGLLAGPLPAEPQKAGTVYRSGHLAADSAVIGVVPGYGLRPSLTSAGLRAKASPLSSVLCPLI